MKLIRKVKDFVHDVRQPENALAVDVALLASLYAGAFCFLLR